LPARVSQQSIRYAWKDLHPVVMNLVVGVVDLGAAANDNENYY
jgi:hypothetical protein